MNTDVTSTTHTEWSQGFWRNDRLVVDMVTSRNRSDITLRDGFQVLVHREVTDWVPEDPVERRRMNVNKALKALDVALRARFENGDSVFEYIIATRPDLKQRFIDWMNTDPREGAVNVD